MDYGDISTKFEQGICKLQKLYTMMTVMGIALLVLSWLTNLIEDDIVPFSTFMRIPTICTSVYGVLVIILATLGTYGLSTRKPSFCKGVYFGCLVFMVMCFIGCVLALTCFFADYKINLASFRQAVGAYEYNSKISQISDELPTKGAANDRRYPDETIIKAEKALRQICLLLSLCLFLFTFIMVAYCITMRTAIYEMQECNDILLSAARSFDPSNMLLSANQPRTLTPRISRSNSTRGADLNTLEYGILLEKEKELYGKFIMAGLSAKGNCENEESYSVMVKDDEIKKPKKENNLQNGKCVTEEILI